MTECRCLVSNHTVDARVTYIGPNALGRSVSIGPACLYEKDINYAALFIISCLTGYNVNQFLTLEISVVKVNFETRPQLSCIDYPQCNHSNYRHWFKALLEGRGLRGGWYVYLCYHTS